MKDEGKKDMLHVGFTGTQVGMTMLQVKAVHNLLKDLKPSVGHHGDCVGADKHFHDLLLIEKIQVHLHPPTNPQKRAFCKADKEYPKKDYLSRNRDIVDCSEIMISTPKAAEELRSGTWSTIRYAKRKKCKLYIVWPDGKIDKFFLGE
jgi:hypothetical protein